MTALLTGLWPYMLMAGAALMAFLGYGARQRSVGRQQQQAKQAEAEKKARDVADEVDNDIGAMPPADARKDLKRWSRLLQSR